MVERYTLSSLDEVSDRLGVSVPDGIRPRFNIAPLQTALIRTASALVAARWGLLPPWRGHGGKRGPHVVHAAVDDLERVPLLRNAFRSQRCLVLADGFYVWRRTGNKPQPVWVHPAADPGRPEARSRLIAFAGLAATHRDDDQPSFAIVVGPASPLVASLVAPPTSPSAPSRTSGAGRAVTAAPTMPIVLAAGGYDTWLTGTREAARMQLDHQPEGWRADPVSTRVSSVEHDDEACIALLGNPAQGELF
ncbi:MAG TPA: SOS response-associated peptidase family protein [Kofleriaceae bacterium]|nr:SOS response-associated peptidase family protein [Kofleriaceae bacterium]